MKFLMLIVGGAAGTLARYLLSSTVNRICGAGFPYGTLLVNLLGCFLIGSFVVLSEERFVLGSYAKVLLMIGFCGAFTTFSTLILESANLMRDGQTLRAFMNVMVSVVAGFAVFKAGMLAAKIW